MFNVSLATIFNIYYYHNLIGIISFILVFDSFEFHSLASVFVCHKL